MRTNWTATLSRFSVPPDVAEPRKSNTMSLASVSAGVTDAPLASPSRRVAAPVRASTAGATPPSQTTDPGHETANAPPFEINKRMRTAHDDVGTLVIEMVVA